jgi:hypothetical protein
VEFPITKILIEFDALPILFTSEGERGTFLVTGIPSSDDNVWYLSFSPGEHDLEKYMGGDIDLYRLMELSSSFTKSELNADGKIYGTGTVFAEFTSLDQSFLPERGLFSSAHIDGFVDVRDEEKIYISGSWDPSNLRSLIKDVGDIYGFLCLIKIKDIKNSVVDLFSKYPWAGGFSATNTFSGIERLVNGTSVKMRFKEISYGSPGEIIYIADKSSFGELVKVLEFATKNKNRDLYYEMAYIYMKKNDIVGKDAKKIVPEDVKIKLKEYIDNIFSVLSIEERDYFFDLCGGNIPLAGKIMLSIYRKVDSLVEYVNSGKIYF